MVWWPHRTDFTPPGWNDERQEELVREMDRIHDALLAVDPKLPPAMQAVTRQELHASRITLLREAERPLFASLADAGYSDAQDWFYTWPNRCPLDALPLLLLHFDLPYPFTVRSAIMRTFVRRDASAHWDELVLRLRREPRDLPHKHVGASQSLANAVAEECPSARRDDLLKLLQDRSLGGDRTLLIDRLWRANRGRYKEAILALGDDPDLAYEVDRKRRGKHPSDP